MTESLGTAAAMAMFIVLSSVTFLALFDVWDIQSTEATDNAAVLTDRINTRISITSTVQVANCDTSTLGISNPGKTACSDLSKLDLIVDYQDSGGARIYRRLDYVTGAVDDNQWALDSITPDTLSPNSWNPGEAVVFDLKVNPQVSTPVSGALVVATPFGVIDSAYFGC